MSTHSGPRIHVAPIAVERSDGGARVTLTATSTEPNVWAATVTFECHGPGAEAVDPMGEMALATFLLPAMRSGASLEIASPTSGRLLDALPKIQQLYSDWESNYSVVDVATSARGEGKVGAGVGLFFSAGVDSFHTLLTTDEPLTHLVFIVGHDFRQGLARRRADAIAGARAVADERGLELIVVDANLRAMPITGEDWKYGHGAALFAIAHGLRGLLGRCLVSATGFGEVQAAWGSHPSLDPLWSTESVQVLHSGIDATRWDKLRLVGAHPLARRYLRVCSDPSTEAYNCGRCGKCAMTMVALCAAGELDAVHSLPHDLGRREVNTIRLNSPLNQGLLAQSLRAFEAAGNDRMAGLIRRRLAPSALSRVEIRVRHLPRRLVARIRRSRLRQTP